jgi:hypothetical protein
MCIFREPVARAAEPGDQEAGERVAHRAQIALVHRAQLGEARFAVHQVVEAIDDAAHDRLAADQIIGAAARSGRGFGHIVLHPGKEGSFGDLGRARH